MLYFPQTRIDISKERAIAVGATILAEGSALAWQNVGGVFGVAPTTGMNDVFAGVSFNGVMNALQAPFMETLTINSAGKIALSFPFLAGTLAIFSASNVPFTAAAPGTTPSTLTATQYVVDAANPTQTLDFNPTLTPALQGTQVTAVYQFAPNYFQQMYLQGMQLPGGPSGPYLGQMDVIQHGDVYTSQFDTSANWFTATGVTLEANGLFGASQALANNIPGVTLIAIPSVGQPFLGISVDVA